MKKGAKSGLSEGTVSAEKFDAGAKLRGHDDKSGIPQNDKATLSTDRGKFTCKP